MTSNQRGGKKKKKSETNNTEEARKGLGRLGGIAFGEGWLKRPGGPSHVSPLGQLLSFKVSVGHQRPNACARG